MMKPWFGLILTVLLFAAPVSAQIPSIPVPPCGGSVTTPNQASPLGSNGWMVYTISTTVGLNICISTVSVAGSVTGVPNSASSATGLWHASVRKEVPTPRPDTYVAYGTHRYVWIFPPPAVLFGVETGYSQSAPVTLNWQEEEVVCQSGNLKLTFTSLSRASVPNAGIALNVGYIDGSDLFDDQLSQYVTHTRRTFQVKWSGR
jgi:hypothetical protein